MLGFDYVVAGGFKLDTDVLWEVVEGDTGLLIRSWVRSYPNQTLSILSNDAGASSHTRDGRRFLHWQNDTVWENQPHLIRVFI